MPQVLMTPHPNIGGFMSEPPVLTQQREERPPQSVGRYLRGQDGVDTSDVNR